MNFQLFPVFLAGADAEVVIQTQNQWVEYDAPIDGAAVHVTPAPTNDASDAIKGLLEMQNQRGGASGTSINIQQQPQQQSIPQSDIITIGTTKSFCIGLSIFFNSIVIAVSKWIEQGIQILSHLLSINELYNFSYLK